MNSKGALLPACNLRSVFCLIALLLPIRIPAQAPSTTTLGTSANPAIFGQALTLTATVTPGPASGKVTFYDGTTILGIGTLSGGQASLITILLPSGSHSLRAYYSGDTAYSASTSATVAQTVVAIPGNSFQAAVNYAAGSTPNSVAVGDFNGDGRADLVVANRYGSNVSVLLGNGDGAFQPAINYNAGGGPIFVAVGDLNGDGKADLAVANYDSASVSVLLGNGDGTFQPVASYYTGIYPQSVAVADFNRDGKPDLAVANAGGTVSVLLGNGDGAFQAAVNYHAGAGAYAVAVGDFNGDGKADLAVANLFGATLGILLGNGDGTFQAVVTYSAGWGAFTLTVGEFNGDGKTDILAANADGSSVSVLLGNGDGTFQTAVNYGTGGGSPQSVTVGDFNGDGKGDLAAANFNGNNVSVLLGNGDGTFQAAVNYSAGSGSVSVAVGDFNGDGIADLAVANWYGGVSILLGVAPNQQPVANAGPNQTIILGETAHFDGSASSDADGTISSFVWNFGDSGVATGANVSHTYAAAGPFTVTLTVTDNQGATGSAQATVTVQTSTQAIQTVTQLVQSFNLQQGITNSLDAKLANVQAALDAANAGARQDAINKLQAFISAVQAQSGKQLTTAQANQLIGMANRIIATL